MPNTQDEGLPPPYTPPHQQPFTAHLAAYLSSLPALVQHAHSTHLSTQQARDGEVLALLIPHIEALLADAAFQAASPSALAQNTAVAELTLVPAAACPTDWKWTEEGKGSSSARKGWLKRMVRVHPTPRKGDAKDGSGREAEKETAERMAEGSRGREHEFDEWGRWGSNAATDDPSSWRDKWDTGEWWWSDEDAASRLSRQLQPPRPASASVSSPNSPALSQDPNASPRAGSKATTPTPKLPPRGTDNTEPKKPRWGFFRSGAREVVESISPVPLPWPWMPVSTPAASGPIVRRNTFADPSRRFVEPSIGAETQTTMAVVPEEVTLRRENDLGIWESRSGWGIVVRLTIPTRQSR